MLRKPLGRAHHREINMEKASLTLAEISRLTNTRLIGNPAHVITNVADLESATLEDASFLASPRYESAMQRSQAGVVFIHSNAAHPDGRNFLLSDDPSLAFQTLVNLLFKDAHEKTGFEGIHPTAVIHPTAKIGKNAIIGPHAVIDKGVIIGENVQIGSGCYIGPHSEVGNDCLLYPNVTVRERCLIGNRVILQPGAVIGSCGFGFVTNKEGKHIKLDQVGNVTIEDDVEIGANTTIDRSRFKTTRIGRGTKIDNLVQIAHGVTIGQDNIIVAQTGIAGSTETGRHVVIGGQSAIAGHIKLADGVMIAACSGVSKSLTKAGKYNGIPAIPLDEYNRNSVYLRNIEKYIDQLKNLTQRIKKLEEQEED